MKPRLAETYLGNCRCRDAVFIRNFREPALVATDIKNLIFRQFGAAVFGANSEPALGLRIRQVFTLRPDKQVRRFYTAGSIADMASEHAGRDGPSSKLKCDMSCLPDNPVDFQSTVGLARAPNPQQATRIWLRDGVVVKSFLQTFSHGPALSLVGRVHKCRGAVRGAKFP